MSLWVLSIIWNNMNMKKKYSQMRNILQCYTFIHIFFKTKKLFSCSLYHRTNNTYCVIISYVRMNKKVTFLFFVKYCIDLIKIHVKTAHIFIKKHSVY